MLMAFCLMSALTLTRLVRKEVGPSSSWRRHLWPCHHPQHGRTDSDATDSGICLTPSPYPPSAHALAPNDTMSSPSAASAVHVEEEDEGAVASFRIVEQQAT